MKSNIGNEEQRNAFENEERKNAFKEMELGEMERGVFQAGMGFLVAMAGLIGVWALACLLSATTQIGLSGMVLGWVSSVTGL
jgi:hypothetical protein